MAKTSRGFGTPEQREKEAEEYYSRFAATTSVPAGVSLALLFVLKDPQMARVIRANHPEFTAAAQEIADIQVKGDYQNQIATLESAISFDDLRDKYRSIAKKVHPDFTVDPKEKVVAEEQFKAVNSIYEKMKSTFTKVSGPAIAGPQTRETKTEFTPPPKYESFPENPDAGTGVAVYEEPQRKYSKPLPSRPVYEEEYIPVAPYAGFNAPGIEPISRPRVSGPSVTGQVFNEIGSRAVKKGVEKATTGALKGAAGKAAEKGAEAAATKAAGATAAKAAAGFIPVAGQVLTATMIAASILNKIKKEAAAFPFAMSALFHNTTAIALAQIGAVTTSLGISLLIGLIAVPTLIAIIIFIVNTSAYVVPPGSGGIGGGNSILPPGQVSAYVNVTKTASPVGPFTNDRLNPTNPDLVVTYTVTISPKRVELFGITFNSECSVITSRTTGPHDCPTLSSLTVNGSQIAIGGSMSTVADLSHITHPDRLRMGEQIIIIYTQNYSNPGQYFDSMITDTFSVTANPTGDPTATTASASASIMIGTPPTGCFVFDTSWDQNPTIQTYKSRTIGQIAYLIQNHSPYTAKLCQAIPSHQLTLTYGGQKWTIPPSGTNPGIEQNGACPDNCVLYQHLFTMPDYSIYYVLTHEFAHRLNWARPSLMTYFERAVQCQAGEVPPNCEFFLPSYAAQHAGIQNKYEDFAETAAWYTTKIRFPTSCQFSYVCYRDMPTSWPLHYCFAQKVLFSVAELPENQFPSGCSTP